MIYRTSRYSTLSAENHNPTPRHATVASNRNKGSHKMVACTPTPSYTQNRHSKTKARMKSTKPENMDEIGISSRGKYTLPMRFALPTRLLEDSVIPLAKNIQGTSAVRLNTEYGTPSEGIFARRPKNSVKISIVNNGCISAHPAPIAVCLYRTLISRQVRNSSSSRYCHSSRTFSPAQPVSG